MQKKNSAVDQTDQPRVFVFSLSFLFNRHLRRMLKASGWRVHIGLPGKHDCVAVWGRSATSRRGLAIARWRKSQVITFEDGFLRSVETGRQGEDGLSFVADRQGIYFKTSRPNDLYNLILASQSASAEDLERAKAGIITLRHNQLSKYNAFPLDPPDLPDRFVLVVDQTRDDASIAGGGAGPEHFTEMLETAIREHPDLPVVIKSHPETLAGKRPGHFDGIDYGDQVIPFRSPVSPWQLFERAAAVYCVSSLLGMEAIFAGHKPVVFGRAFYSGWGLTDDRHLKAEHIAERSPVQLFHATFHKYCQWFDPYSSQASSCEQACRTLASKARAWRNGQRQVVCTGMRLWKRGFLRRYFSGAAGPPRFVEVEAAVIPAAKQAGGPVVVWAGKETLKLRGNCDENNIQLIRVEDGFLRSAGLGANLVPPLSLAFDDLGIYYDPTRECRLERLIEQSGDLPKPATQRALNLKKIIVTNRLSKYNLGGNIPDIVAEPNQKRILIPGQVEDDASILLGASDISTNLSLITETRAKYPNDHLIYKVHPDVHARLRDGAVDAGFLKDTVDTVIETGDIAKLLDQVDIVSTMTSLTGFEALVRGKHVVCYGAPFYAGWGLTEDHGQIPERRRARPTLAGLIHAALIDYPRYWDPVTGNPCPVEVVLERLASGELGRGSGPSIRALAKLQGLLASYAHWWR
ncbi:MAG: capsular polysaccharide biosynthesis protein [Rhodobacteraceae bacterium]|nr:capsular polysaccharide biosynthesis protein [Paracoccaceae bacterium]